MKGSISPRLKRMLDAPREEREALIGALTKPQRERGRVIFPATRNAITVVSGKAGDWVGLYIGDELKFEGHSLQLDSVLRHLGYDVYSYEVDQAYLEENGLHGSLAAMRKETKLDDD